MQQPPGLESEAELAERLVPTRLPALLAPLREVGSPRARVKAVHEQAGRLLALLRQLRAQLGDESTGCPRGERKSLPGTFPEPSDRRRVRALRRREPLPRAAAVAQADDRATPAAQGLGFRHLKGARHLRRRQVRLAPQPRAAARRAALPLRAAAAGAAARSAGRPARVRVCGGRHARGRRRHDRRALPQARPRLTLRPDAPRARRRRKPPRDRAPARPEAPRGDQPAARRPPQDTLLPHVRVARLHAAQPAAARATGARRPLPLRRGWPCRSRRDRRALVPHAPDAGRLRALRRAGRRPAPLPGGRQVLGGRPLRARGGGGRGGRQTRRAADAGRRGARRRGECRAAAAAAAHAAPLAAAAVRAPLL
mmetsp:Transcript_22736/g.64765  ORF Transcript_22736/g.64765 Transcript_22736/m.64765 type:complete len:368 (-) Transcript_22736:269-1372(-)